MEVLLGSVIGALIYFAPSMVAYSRRHRNTRAIFYMNLFLGWTFLGWVGAVIWAHTKDVEPLPVKTGYAEKRAALMEELKP